MPLPGGAADKYGARYEGRWTVRCMLYVMLERAASIHLEPPAQDGVEFVLTTKRGREYHQAKRQIGGKAGGCWSIADLSRAGVLGHCRDRLESDDGGTFHFLSGHAASPLDELSDRARRASSLLEFRGSFLQDAYHSGQFAALTRALDRSEEHTFVVLQRVHVHTMDERSLEQEIELFADVATSTDPNTVVDILASFALDQVHRALSSHDLWQHLRSRGVHPRDWRNDATVLARVRELNDRYRRLPRDQVLLDGEFFGRPEAETCVSILTAASGKRDVFLAGPAGVGKSAVLKEVMRQVELLGWPVLAVRADRLDPVRRAAAMGKQLELPSSPVAVLAAIAGNQPCFLVIDQLDAVSMASGRHPWFFDAFEELLWEAERVGSMRVLVACRKFDADHDPRFRALLASRFKEVPVSGLTEARVREVVGRLGVDAMRLSPTQLRLLSTPLHLVLFASIEPENKRSFQTALDLFDRFWYRKQGDIRTRLDSCRWTDVIDLMIDGASAAQRLVVRESSLDGVYPDLNAMISENVLVREDRNIAFFHEAFFDYAFARRFCGRGGKLVTFLRDGDQTLFRRSQVRAILSHQRGSRDSRYLPTLAELLNDPGIRSHIKQLVVSWLRDLPDPSDSECEVLEAALTRSGPWLQREIAWSFQRSSGWFRAYDRVGYLSRWLLDDELRERALRHLHAMREEFPQRVLDLVEPFLREDGWRQRIGRLLQWGPMPEHRGFFEELLRQVEAGFFDKGDSGTAKDFWSVVSSVVSRQPEWACEAVGRLLLREARMGRFGSSQFAVASSETAEVIDTCVQRASSRFVREIFPFLELSLTMRAETQLWRFRSRRRGHSLEDLVLQGLERALMTLARDEPGEFRPFAQRLKDLHFETSDFLLIRGYTASASAFPDEAIGWLLDDHRRLEIHYTDAVPPVACELLAAASQHCSTENLAALEIVLLDWFPEWEQKLKRTPEMGDRGIPLLRLRGYSQYLLLNAILVTRQSRRVARRLAEWHRRFAFIATQTDDDTSQVVVVGSPVPHRAYERMSDLQWIGAIARYHDDRDRRRMAVGGAYQLSQQLEQRARAEPKRFGELAVRLPDDTNPHYFDAVLRALTDVAVESGIRDRLLRRCDRLPGRPSGRWVMRLLQAQAETDVPDDILRSVCWHATEHPDPAREEDRDEAASRDILTTGINSARGAAAEAIAALVRAIPARLAVFRVPLERMASDPSIAVRSCVASAIQAALAVDENAAIPWFRKLLEGQPDELLLTPYIERLLLAVGRRHPTEAIPILRRMIASPVDELQEEAARCVAFVSLLHAETKPLLEECIAGGEPQRRGVAGTMAENVAFPACREACTAALCRLFLDPAASVSSEAASCFRTLRRRPPADISPYAGLVEAFVESCGKRTAWGDVVEFLLALKGPLPPAALRLCERFAELVGEDASDLQSGAAMNASAVNRLILRTYHQLSDAESQRRCLDTLDRLTEIGAYGLEATLAEVER